MVSDPEQWLEPMRAAGANQFTFHYEAITGGDVVVNSLIDKVKKSGLKCGLAIKPKTSVCNLELFFYFYEIYYFLFILIMHNEK